MSQKKKKKKSKKNLVLNIVLVVCLICFVVSAGVLVKYFWDGYETQKELSQLSELILSDEELEAAQNGNAEQTDENTSGEATSGSNRYEKLLEENEDFIGWIEIEGTDISYPVMYTPDDPEYYLHRNFEQEYEYSGLPFVDGNCSLRPRSTNVIIYSHNMKNGTMFHELLEYKDEDFYEEHPYVTFNTIYEDAEYEIVSVILARALDEDEEGFRYYSVIDIDSQEEFDDYMENIEALEIYDTGVEAEYGDELLTLSTCEYSQDDGRLAVIAKKR